jgi:carbonic anhydrase/acetyltransferase-like protein (isoleucine patch superfamily)
VGKQSFIAAGAVLPEGMVVPRQSLALGVPAKVKPVTPALLERIDIGWQTYLTLARAQLPTWPTLKGDPAHQVRREPRR